MTAIMLNLKYVFVSKLIFLQYNIIRILINSKFLLKFILIGYNLFYYDKLFGKKIKILLVKILKAK